MESYKGVVTAVVALIGEFMVITSPPIQSWTDDTLRVIRPGLSFFETGKGPQGPNQIDWKGEEIECGKVKGKLKCESGHEVYMTSYCYRQECPVCWHQWLARQLKAVKRRFQWVRTTSGGDTKHVVVSFTSMPSSKSELSKMRRAAIKAVKSVGITGGMIVAHYHKRADGREGIHFHLIALGRVVRSAVAETYYRTGIVIKEIRGGALARSLIHYELDHAVKVAGVHTVTWFGILHAHFISVRKEEVSAQRLCTHRNEKGVCCGRPLFEDRVVFHWDGGLSKMPPAKEIIIEYHFNWRRKPII